MQALKDFLKHQDFKYFLRSFLLYAPLCVAFFLIVNFFVQRHLAQIEAQNRQEEIYFKKYEGNLKTPLAANLQEDGISKELTAQIIKKLDSVLNMRRLAPRDRYLLTMTETDDFKMLVVTKDFSRYYVAQSGGELVAGIMDISVKTRESFAQGVIESSLFASMQKAGLKPGFIVEFADLFSWAIDFNAETRNGDTFAVLWQEDYTAGGAVLNQSVLAAYYDGKYAGKHYAIRFDDEFYDENGKFTKKMFLKAPISVRGARITSRFTKGRFHPILRIMRPHYGIDYAAPIGTPVESVGDGIVKFKGWKGGFGNYVEVAHPNNFVTCYGHLKNFGKGVSVGARVRQGQVVGYVGSSGLSTGPHLDFRMRQGGKYLDFLNSKNRSSAQREIPPERKEEFNKIKDEYLERMAQRAKQN
ncbi:MAG: M23 family metallopeptidase [Syntrophomonadaceae bacterium]|jgi:murein DD-endopeptidase MepM/ murein hydrolase activator NlpD|nr:M23 family metallopeptidase [Syntrophomonadaceae bacterium]